MNKSQVISIVVGVLAVVGLLFGFGVFNSTKKLMENTSETVETISETVGANNDTSDQLAEQEEAEQSTDGFASDQQPTTFTADVWADNWFAMYVNGELAAEDSVSIDTERSFNKESFTFEASYPMTIAIEAKDFKETDSGLEYIGDNNQQMGDGGVIAQIKNESGDVIAATDNNWASLVVHEAPLDKSCEKSSNPEADCEFKISETPNSWFAIDFDDSDWSAAGAYTEAEVDPKFGYDEVVWDGSAQLIWGDDLETNNTVLLRTTIE